MVAKLPKVPNPPGPMRSAVAHGGTALIPFSLAIISLWSCLADSNSTLKHFVSHPLDVVDGSKGVGVGASAIIFLWRLAVRSVYFMIKWRRLSIFSSSEAFAGTVGSKAAPDVRPAWMVGLFEGNTYSAGCCSMPRSTAAASCACIAIGIKLGTLE